MEGSLSKVCQYYDQEVPATVKKIFSVMEPLVIVLLAFVVLGVALSMYLPSIPPSGVWESEKSQGAGVRIRIRVGKSHAQITGRLSRFT